MTDIQNFKTTPEFETFENKLQKHIDQFQTELKERKHLKYVRDKRDFDTGSIYPVVHTTTYGGDSRNNYYTDLSESKVSGTDEGRSISPRHQIKHRTKSRQRGGYGNHSYNRGTRFNQQGRAQQRDRFPPKIYSTRHPVKPLGTIPSAPSLPLSLPPQLDVPSGASSSVIASNKVNPSGSSNAHFLGPPSITLHDRDRWGYNQK